MVLAGLMERDRDMLTAMVVSEVGTPVTLCGTLQVSTVTAPPSLDTKTRVSAPVPRSAAGTGRHSPCER